ncbi:MULTISPECIES: chorismate mutase [Haloarcula]|uniref:Chorismate mutase domain-containing protein n=1 Tax=Haloarcula pellucida TaxID=1427151 RepID=A0A830GPQ9_9EURY|nr:MULTISPECIES: chorismate mutase [Halomicroarcula]MBX0349952.1 chorismate mutase [Halomicroarcula pellucida]MDS0279700.1 chorismate mutase [Halomicroarcula sp. S1AR25-4]GGN95165.1 hypothetical protein GCM10009030_22280 [Halomicroarcula pellucida]
MERNHTKGVDVPPQTDDPTETDLEQVRASIADIDRQITELLETRTKLAKRAGELKLQSDDHDFVDEAQSDRVVERAREYAVDRDVDENVVSAAFRLFVHMGMTAEWRDRTARETTGDAPDRL